MEFWASTPELAGRRITVRSRKLLDRAAVSPEALRRFCRINGLPAHPFFPLFLTIKRDWFAARAQKAIRREEEIRKRVLKLPEERRKILRFCAEVEKRYHPRKDYPIWTRSLWPQSLKRAGEYEKAGPLEWDHHYRRFFTLAGRRYRGFSPLLAERLSSCFLLGCLPDPLTLAPPPSDEIRRRFRILCKQHHPDAGGDPHLFIRLKEAEELLLQKRPGR